MLQSTWNNQQGMNFKKIAEQAGIFSEEQFENLFRNNLTFCMAFCDELGRDIQNISQFGSNIAKYSLIELSNNLEEGVPGWRAAKRV